MTEDNPLNLTQDLLGEVVAYAFQAAAIEAVTDTETSEAARLLRGKLKALETKIESSRVMAKHPYVQAGKQIDGLANVIFDQIRPHIKRLDDLRLAYAQAYTQPQMPVAPWAGLDPETFAVPDLTSLAQAVSAEPPVIRTRTAKDIEITDITQIPDEFWTIDVVALRRAVLTDKRDVPGVRIVEKQSVLE